MTVKKKLIEVALPLEAINKASSREKSIRHGHPSTMHLWWARRPLAACRAVLFAQLVDDPSSHPDKFPTEASQEKERQRLFKIIEELVKWENSNNDRVLEMARQEIFKSCDGELPVIYDPFSGGGSIPFEAQRLGLPAYGSDLNPVAVMIGKAMIEFPPKFSGWKPVNPESKKDWTKSCYKGAQGLAEDVRYYGRWIRDKAESELGHLYPHAKLPNGSDATVIAWIWASTVPSPDPSCNGVPVPLAATFIISTKKGKEAYVEPVVDRSNNSYRFEVRLGKVPSEKAAAITNGTKASRGPNFTCLISGSPISGEHIKAMGMQGKMGSVLMAMVCEGSKGTRLFLSPTKEMMEAANAVTPTWDPEGEIAPDRRSMFTPLYGLTHFRDLFTKRQKHALTTFANLIYDARNKILEDAKASGMPDDGISLEAGGMQASSYADVVSIYLACAVDRSANYWSRLTPWGKDFIVQTFGRQALPMVWDHAEANPFSSSTGNWLGAIDWIARVLETFFSQTAASIIQKAAQDVDFTNAVISTDPPYYDNIGYSDLADFFYVWARKSLLKIYPSLFSTILTPKREELVALPYRHGNKEKAEIFFMEGMTKVLNNIAIKSNAAWPITIYYAFKQSEASDEGIVSTGWASFLSAIIKSNLMVDGTWPLRTERDQGLKSGTNVLASSIVLVCRRRPNNSDTISRNEFVTILKKELPLALKQLQQANIEPADIPQSSIGPGIGIFSRYAKVIEADGSEMNVRTALALINKAIDEIRSEQDTDYDDYTRFGVSWFEQFGFEPGPYGVAENVATARGISVQGVKEAGLVDSGTGKVRILKRNELPKDWSPLSDNRLTVWEITQHMVRILNEQGLDAAARLFREVGGTSASAKELAYRLFDICEKKKWSEEATVYSGLIKEWPEIEARAAVLEASGEERQAKLAL